MYSRFPTWGNLNLLITLLPGLREKDYIWQEKAGTVRGRKRRIIPAWVIPWGIITVVYPSAVRQIINHFVKVIVPA